LANQPFDVEVINPRERPLSSDIDLIGTYASQMLREFLIHAYAHRFSITDPTSVASSGFLGSGFRVTAANPAAMTAVVSSGLGFFYDATDLPSAIGGVAGLNDLSAYKPITLTSDQSIPVPAADPGNPRIDIVEVKQSRRIIDPTSRDVLNVGTGAFDPNTVSKTLTFNLNGTATVNGTGPINYKVGTPAVVPVAPTPDAGYTKIAEIDVPALAVTLPQSRFRDFRRLIFPGGVGEVLAKFTITTAPLTTFSNLVAPPGVLVGITNGGGVNANLYVFCGDAFAYARTEVLHGDALTDTSEGQHGGASISPTNIAGGEVAVLQPVALQTIISPGQPALRLSATTLPGDGGPLSSSTYYTIVKFGL
jgi:hypothetical protein